MIAPRRNHPDAIGATLAAQVVIAWPVTLAGLSADPHPATLEVTISLDSATPTSRCLLRDGTSLRTLPISSPPTATIDPAADLLHLDGPGLAATILLAGPSPRLLYARFRFDGARALGPGAIEEPSLR